MKTLLACLAAASIFCAGCSDTTESETKDTSVQTLPDGKQVKTETEVEKKTTVD